jgi:predicted nucleic acid-binding protein
MRMHKRYYFDTSVWHDFFEDRNEPNFPKGEWAKKLVDKIIAEKSKIIVSEVVKNELITLGYSRYDVEELFFPFRYIIDFVYSNKKQFGRAKDLSK